MRESLPASLPLTTCWPRQNSTKAPSYRSTSTTASRHDRARATRSPAPTAISQWCRRRSQTPGPPSYRSSPNELYQASRGTPDWMPVPVVTPEVAGLPTPAVNVAPVYTTFAHDLRHGTSPRGGDVADLVFAMRCTLHHRRQVSGRVFGQVPACRGRHDPSAVVILAAAGRERHSSAIPADDGFAT